MSATAMVVGYEFSGAGESAQVNASRLSAGMFLTLGVMPLMGRFFTQQEDEDRQHVAVIGYSFWRSRLHGDPHVLGAQILLDRQPYVVADLSRDGGCGASADSGCWIHSVRGRWHHSVSQEISVRIPP
jgi:hypothetical protein